MSLTFIDPLSENFAYLSPVIYCPSCAQLVFNTLPGALRSSSLNTAEGACHGGPYFTARPRQHQGLPETVGGDTHLLPPASGQLPGSRHTLTAGQGDRMGLGPSELLLLLKAQLQLPKFSFSYCTPKTTASWPLMQQNVGTPESALLLETGVSRHPFPENQDLSPPGGEAHCPSRYLTGLPEDIHQEESQITHVPRQGQSDSDANR